MNMPVTDASPGALQTGSVPVGSREYLSFRLGGEEYAIDILHVQEIRSYERPTRVPQSAPQMLGVVNLRGVIVPIVDLRLHLGSAEAAYGSATVVIVLNLQRATVGVVVDSVSDVIVLSPEEIRSAPALASQQIDTAFVRGVATVSDRMLILMDIQALLGSVGLGLMGAS